MKKRIFHLVKIMVAVQLLAISINLFLGPHNIAAGGVSGIGILAEAAFGIDRSIIVLGLNLLMLILTAIFLGREVLINTAVGSLLFPLALAFTPEVMVTDNTLLSVIFGSAIFGTGVAILYKIRASSGGTTIPPLIFKKYYNLSPTIGLLVTDAAIVTLTLLVFGFEEFLLAILSLIITSIVMNYIETGLKRRKAILIISQNNYQAMRDQLIEEVPRGMTLFDVVGGKTGNSAQMIMMISSNQDFPAIMAVIDQVDPGSFVIVYNVSEVHGLGFSYQAIV
ncbi:YitT family protein [Vagococcus sp. BWB3-3]|uniref:YitT family protein n=1 Tax=Vagococcus allomyrinae TaxID=2794353 RepID=A0A940SVT4_9ENTE|nr:YitT family protein [Vagococcus allomyrinae]MBP1040663.1 YitT family protein [Vagococcus allomyrinae]